MAVEGDADIMIVMKPFKEWTSAGSRAEMVAKMKEALKPITGAEFNFRSADTASFQRTYDWCQGGYCHQTVRREYGGALCESERGGIAGGESSRGIGRAGGTGYGVASACDFVRP